MVDFQKCLNSNHILIYNDTENERYLKQKWCYSYFMSIIYRHYYIYIYEGDWRILLNLGEKWGFVAVTNLF